MKGIDIKNLTKKYKNRTAVDTLNLTIKEGEFFALLGTNGAGKTTTIKMLSCLLEPTSGDAIVHLHLLVQRRLKCYPVYLNQQVEMHNCWETVLLRIQNQ